MDSLRAKYNNFRELLSLNNDCLELLAGLQEDLQYVPPSHDVLGERVDAVCSGATRITQTLAKLTGNRYDSLLASVQDQRQEVEGFLAARGELLKPKLSVWLSEIDASAVAEVGGKAATLAEVKNKLGLSVPDGYVLTTEAYYQFCGLPLWASVRDTLRNADPGNLEELQEISAKLRDMVMSRPVPKAVEVDITARAQALHLGDLGLAVRSSAVGEGGERSFAGQYRSRLNVSPDKIVDTYRRVVAGRFSQRALVYRLSTGLLDVENPMAVLFLPVIRARAAGVMYTRDPRDPGNHTLWVTATFGLGLDLASGRTPADLFVVSHGRSHTVVDSSIVQKQEEVIPQPGGGLSRLSLDAARSRAPSLQPAELATLAELGVRIERHFDTPQDVEWVLDEDGRFWIVQTRSLAVVESSKRRGGARPRGEPLVSGGRTVYPGRISGRAYLASDRRTLRKTPKGAILFVRRASPEIVEVFPCIAGLVTEWGNVTGHTAVLLREFRIPSVFEMAGAFERIRAGDPVSLDAVRPSVYAGDLWPPPTVWIPLSERYRSRLSDPISERFLKLNLLDPAAASFRPFGCKSTHDVLRFCHEKAIEAMFTVNDTELERGQCRPMKLISKVPANLHVLDLGGGLALEDPDTVDVTADQIVCRPFQALWKGVTHPGVSWKREMPASFGDLASVMAGSLASTSSAVRALGDRSYVLVAEEYMNFNSRLAYHFTLVDACVSDTTRNNYISFRFAGGGSTRHRRSLRACFVEACLDHYGYQADRRGDLVNAWFKRAPAAETEEKLDILGRLMACANQLDMYMTSHDAMMWYVEQFLEGNYAFRQPEEEAAEPPARA